GVVTPANQRQLLQWAEAVRFGLRGPVGTPFPDTLSDIARLADDDEGSFEDEVRLLAARLRVHSERMARFIHQRQRLDAALTRSDFAESLQRLAEIESTFGTSIWLMKLKIAVVAYSSGLEAQKTMANDFVARRGRSPVSSIVKFVSQRNEESTSAARYISRMKDVLDRAKLQESTRVHYNYHLTYRVPTDEKSLRWLLLHQSQVSLIDAYEALVSAAIVIAAQRSTSKVVLDLLKDLFDLGDSRLSKLLFIEGRVGDGALKTRRLDLDHALL